MTESDQDTRPQSDEVQSEYFIDKTEYHEIMAEALKTTSGVQQEGAPIHPLPPKQESAPLEPEKDSRRFFYFLAVLYIVLVFGVGFIAYKLTQT